MPSALYEIQRAKEEAVTIWLLHLHFDAYFDIPAKDFYFASTSYIDFYIDDEEIRFDFGLTEVPKGRHQRDRGNDYAEFSIINDGNANYQDFRPYEDIIERGYLHIYQALQIDKDYYEGEIKFVGYVQDFTLDETSKSLKFTALSDMSRKNFYVAARILTRERCGTEFNFDGLNAPEFHACGWQTIQGGNPDHCTKFLEGEDSCVAHGNAHRFFAVPGLSTANVEFVPNGEVDFPYNTGGCFTDKMFVLMADDSIKPIGEVQVGDKHLALNISTQEIVAGEILETFVHDGEKAISCEFARGSVIETTANHLFNTKTKYFAPIGSMRGEWLSGLDSDKKRALDRLERISDLSELQTVYNLHSSLNTFIVCDENRQFYYIAHNRKEHTPINF
jgi:hypothetical protein